MSNYYNLGSVLLGKSEEELKDIIKSGKLYNQEDKLCYSILEGWDVLVTDNIIQYETYQRLKREVVIENTLKQKKE